MKAFLNHFTITKVSGSFVRISYDCRKCFNLPASGTFAAITAFCPYTGEHGSVKTRILTYFMQPFLRKISFLPMNICYFVNDMFNEVFSVFTLNSTSSSCWVIISVEYFLPGFL